MWASGAGAAAGAGAVALRGLAAGRVSRAAAPADLLAAAAQADADHKPVYVDLDAEGYLSCRGGAAALAARARLAPGGALQLEARAGGLRLRLRAPAPPHAELLLWPRADLLAAAALPALAPNHSTDSGEYVCHRCSARFPAPHALRVHLFLACRAATALRFYSTLLQRLAAPAGLAPAPPAACTSLPAASSLPAAQLEALCTAWGRGAGGGAGHACVYCGRLYSRRYGLKIHLRTHTGYKPLRCPHCRRAFGDPSNLNKHVKLHAGAARGAHGCALCGKALARRRDLERHLRARHAPPPLARAPHGDATACSDATNIADRTI